MENPNKSKPGFYAVSRSRGKQQTDSLFTTKMREKRRAHGVAHSSDESESEDDDGPDTTVLHKLFSRKVVLHPDGTVVKSGKRIEAGEAEALKTAAAAGIPVPEILSVHTDPDGTVNISMSHVQGEPLDKLWPNMSAEEKKDVARQLRLIVEKMRSAPAPSRLIGACDGKEVRDTRVHFTYHSPACRDEAAFNEYMLSALSEHTPTLVREALSRRLRTDHRIVLSHCDLTPRNILVQSGKIVGLVDWEASGWYPEHWEYVKFFQRPAEHDWKQYAGDIFPTLYHDELVDFMAISRWQHS